jgi:hypothetical protein
MRLLGAGTERSGAEGQLVTDRQAGRQTDRQTDRQADRQTDRWWWRRGGGQATAPTPPPRHSPQAPVHRAFAAGGASEPKPWPSCAEPSGRSARSAAVLVAADRVHCRDSESRSSLSIAWRKHMWGRGQETRARRCVHGHTQGSKAHCEVLSPGECEAHGAHARAGGRRQAAEHSGGPLVLPLSTSRAPSPPAAPPAIRAAAGWSPAPSPARGTDAACRPHPTTDPSAGGARRSCRSPIPSL